MICLFALSMTEETATDAAKLAPGADKALRVLAAQAGLPSPTLLWAGDVPDAAFDGELIRARAGLHPGAVYLYDDSTAVLVERVQKVSP